jgi:hypothetical protein
VDRSDRPAARTLPQPSCRTAPYGVAGRRLHRHALGLRASLLVAHRLDVDSVHRELGNLGLGQHEVDTDAPGGGSRLVDVEALAEELPLERPAAKLLPRSPS